MNNTRPGYMIVFALMMVALVMVMITGVVERARVHTTTMQVLIDKQKARMLALSGLEITLCRLANPPQEEKKEVPSTAVPTPPAQAGKPEGQSKQQDPTQEAKSLLSILMPQLDAWQSFAVEENKAAEYGTIKICIGCESGKVNLNHLYDFSKHEFLGDKDKEKGAKVFVEQLCAAIEKSTGGKNLFEKLSAYLKQRKYPLNDPSELLSIKEFSTAFADAVVLKPRDDKNEKNGNQQQIYFLDLFTAATPDKQLQPLLLSPSLKQALGFKQTTEGNRELLKEVIQKFKPTAQWQQEWNQVLAPLYGKEFSALSPALVPLLSTKFEPMVFSVVSYGSVKNITQKLYAIIERKRSSEKDGPLYEISVKRVYWL